MVRIISTFIIGCSIFFNAFGQTGDGTAGGTFEKYLRCVEQKDNGQVVEFYYPKLYRFFPKGEVLKSMEQTDSDTARVITIRDGKIASISDSLVVNGIKYTLIKYRFRMVMTFPKKKPKTGDNDFAEYTCEVLKEQYGAGNVSYSKERGQLTVDGTNEAYAIKDPAYKGWKFLENSGNMAGIIEKLLPKKVMERL